MNNEEKRKLFDEIKVLKRERNAVILTHYYALPELQEIADFLGDSLALSQQAADTAAEVIVFCGVEFMAETAAIISPEKTVLIPAEGAGCTLAESCTAAGLATWKKYNPGGLVVSYVNTSAEVKAETDYCVTSSNALKVIQTLPKDAKILFGPDKNLGEYIKLKTGRNMEVWQGDCYVHRHITPEVVLAYLERYPEADILIHPESEASTDARILASDRCFIGSTSYIIDHPARSAKQCFVIATEVGVLTQLYRQYPGFEFIPIVPDHTCEYMKKTTLEGLRDALRDMKYVVTVPREVRERAIVPIRRMLAVK